MSDEPSSSAAAYTSDISTNGPSTEAVPTAAQLAERKKNNRQLFNRKRGDLLDDVLRNLDILVYAELSAIYYMDCSFIRFLIRGLIQFVFLTPKPAAPPAPPLNKPYIGAILGSNILCILLHIIYAPPSGSEATRGYLHGGLAMDFIGQKGPTSKVHLLLLDLLVVILQLVHLSTHITRTRLKDSSVSVTTSSGTQYTATAIRQDHDAEERGVRRSGEHQDIEMQTLNPSGTSTEPVPNRASTTERADDTLASTSPRTDAHIFNAFNSGQIVLADLDIFQTTRDQFWAYATTPAEDSTTSIVEMRRNIIGQLLRWRSGAVTGRPAERIV
ncbi:hypothetical protein LTR78_004348 [Recurvomyces mirabilis]|uniref:DUF1746 domain-containing protein n=1 Tax=Recurvomyces mirabilis TaxID=574656 RepID=A0AAE0WPQ5_9PEZI|nr:hypothetical protein LTR78_004348 [Recurvomyces mirabilis]KAK5155986.1 hypothetical protein LTS14_005552 [Recurvomyces mirabilis]